MGKREFKKDHILCCGIKVMHAQGYNGTSVKDIVDAAEVPKGSFYNYFESKEVFAIEALDKVADEHLLNSRHLLLANDDDALSNLQRYFTHLGDNLCEHEFSGGCFFGNMCQEMSDTSDKIRCKVEAILKQNTQLICEVLVAAKTQGKLNPDANCELMAEFIFNAWEGTVMRMKGTKCSNAMQAFSSMLPIIVR